MATELKKSIKKHIAMEMLLDGRFDDIHVIPYGIVFRTVEGHFGIGASQFMLDNLGHLFSLAAGWGETVDVSSGSSAWIVKNLARTLESL